MRSLWVGPNLLKMRPWPLHKRLGANSHSVVALALTQRDLSPCLWERAVLVVVVVVEIHCPPEHSRCPGGIPHISKCCVEDTISIDLVSMRQDWVSEYPLSCLYRQPLLCCRGGVSPIHSSGVSGKSVRFQFQDIDVEEGFLMWPTPVGWQLAKCGTPPHFWGVWGDHHLGHCRAYCTPIHQFHVADPPLEFLPFLGI